MFNHLDQVKIQSTLTPTVYRSIVGSEYHELWDSSKFLSGYGALGDPAEVLNSNDGQFIYGTIVRKSLTADEYLVAIPVAHPNTYFSDKNYLSVPEKDMTLNG